MARGSEEGEGRRGEEQGQAVPTSESSSALAVAACIKASAVSKEFCCLNDSSKEKPIPYSINAFYNGLNHITYKPPTEKIQTKGKNKAGP